MFNKKGRMTLQNVAKVKNQTFSPVLPPPSRLSDCFRFSCLASAPRCSDSLSQRKQRTLSFKPLQNLSHLDSRLRFSCYVVNFWMVFFNCWACSESSWAAVAMAWMTSNWASVAVVTSTAPADVCSAMAATS